MSANVETMFSVRETPWHGLGRIVMDAPASREALELAGLNWQVESRNIYSGTGAMIPGYRANVRSTDDAVLGVVSDRYRIVQNEEAFQFTDDLLGEGVTYETAGSLQGGKKVWMLAKLPEKYIIAGDEVTPYLVLFNSHDGSSGVKVAMTPVRVVCQNSLNLALGTAKRIWTARHTENVLLRVQDARETLQLANSYMGELGKGIHELLMLVIECKIVPRFFKFTASDLIVLVIVQCATFPVRVNASCITNDFYHQRGIAFHIEVLCNIQPVHFPFNRILNFKESKLF